MQQAHSLLLPPSGANIWFPDRCSGSSHAQKHLPDLYSLPAIEGVGAHMHAQACFNVGINADKFQGPNRSFNGVKITNDQVQHVQDYVDLIRSRPGSIRYIELKMSLPGIHSDLFGTLDSGVYDAVTGILFIDDLKYGFDDVSAVDNPQLWIYATMLVQYLWKMFKIVPKRIQIGIFQPRSNQGERESYQQISYEELIAWRDTTLVKAVKAAVNPQARRTPGAHCKHCKAKLNCPEYGEWSNYNVEPPFPLTDESIVKIMEVAPTFKRLHEDALVHGTDRRQRGFNLAGTKLVRKVKHRILTDAQLVANELLEEGATPEQIYKNPEIKSPNQLEKSVDKKLKPIIEKYSHKPRGDVVIALLKDNRTAIATTQEVFNNVN